MANDVSGLLAGFRLSRSTSAKNEKAHREMFVSNMKSSVGAIRQEFAADLIGARRAWATLSPAARRAKVQNERQAKEAQLAQQRAKAEAELKAREEAEKEKHSLPSVMGKKKDKR